MYNMYRAVKLAMISVRSMHFAIIAHLFVDYLVYNVTAQLHQMPISPPTIVGHTLVNRSIVLLYWDRTHSLFKWLVIA